jgi:O6-methylguanine-DNA--protein-cysteine methyltransferase
MSQQTRRQASQGDEEANTPLLLSPQDIPNASSSPRSNASRSFPHHKSTTTHYSTFIEQHPPQQSQQKPNLTNPTARSTKPKLPMRTTKISQKLKLFPEDAGQQWFDEDIVEEGQEQDVYTQIAKIPHGMARQEAEMLNKMDRNELSRMTAYCTAR